MKSTSHAGAILVLVMIIMVLASLFWFLYGDYDAVREQADMADSRATRAAAMEKEAGQLRAEADQIELTRTALEAELGTAVTSQKTLVQESVDDQQMIQQLETRVAAQIPADSVPEVVIITPEDGESLALSSVVLTVAAFDLNGLSAIKIVFDNNPPLEIPIAGKTSAIIQEPWPLSEAGEHTAGVTAVNRNNISSQVTAVTITIENKPTSQQIVAEVANIMGLADAQATENNQVQAPANGASQSVITPLILQAFDFEPDQPGAETTVWGSYCASSATPAPVSPELQPAIDSPAQELALVKALVQEWQTSQFQFNQKLAAAPDDDARAALCALAAGHERWVLEEYIRRAPAERQAALLENLTPQMSSDPRDVLSAQQNFGAVFGPAFINAMTAASGTTAVLDAWNRLPQTTAQILDPTLYAANSGSQSVTLPDLTAVLGDWTAVTSNVLGAFMLGQYLGNYAEATGVETAVSGWNGDQFAIYQQGFAGPLLLALQINWLSDQDAQEFADVFGGSINGRLPQAASVPASPENSTCWTDPIGETICLFTNGTQSLLVSAPQQTTAVDTLTAINNN